MDAARRWAQHIGNLPYEASLDDVALVVRAALVEATQPLASREQAYQAILRRMILRFAQTGRNADGKRFYWTGNEPTIQAAFNVLGLPDPWVPEPFVPPSDTSV